MHFLQAKLRQCL